ncbi:MAG: IPT/TIG domain-containing protein [Proteobacteria bacterium]|nr:IPT/TIG domain-containing protein [Pseudomonadota bacterium]
MRLLEQLFHALRNVSVSLLAMLIDPRQNLRNTALGLVVLLCAPIFAAAQPLIQSIDPSQGPIAGSAQVTLAGPGFAGTTLTLDGKIVTPTSASDTQIIFQTPAHDNGIVTVKISGSGPNAYTEFLYVPPRLQDLPPGYITTVAGVGLFTGLYRQATQAEVYPQGSPAFDRQGNMYIPEPNINRVTRVRPDGIIEPFAGNGIPDYQSTSGIGDGGPAAEASLTFPRGVTTDAAGNVYITEYKGRIRRVNAQGIITTVAGGTTRGFSGDGGPAVQARLNDATQITGDGNGTLYFIDFNDRSTVARIRKITPEGIISTVAGIGPPGFSGDGGPATQAQFNLIYGDRGSLALDSEGNLFIADSGNERIRRIDGRTGIITTVYSSRNLDWGGVAADQSGNIFIYDDNRIIKMGPSGEILDSYGSATHAGSSQDDGTPIQNVNIASHGMAIDASGNIVYAFTNRVCRLNLSTGLLETLAGIGPRIIGDNGPAISTYFAGATDLAFLPSGELLIGDQGHFVMRKLDRNGDISTYVEGGSGSLGSPTSIETDSTGNVLVSDMWNVYRIDPAKNVSLLIGSRQNECGYSGDGGPASQALLCEPFDVALDRTGNLFVADTNNNRIRRVDGQTGIITTVAGSGPVNGFERFEADGQGSFSGDGGPATQATLNTPYGVAVDAQGNLFIADSGNRRIRKVDTSGLITTFASSTDLISVNRLEIDSAGNLFSVLSKGVFRYDPNGNATQIAGSWPPGFSGDGGPALGAKTRTGAQSAGVAVDTEGNVFFFDVGNLRVRAIRYGAVMAGQASTVNVGSGSAQTTLVGTSFPITLQIDLKSSEGSPAYGVRVDFTAPNSGASCTFPNGSAAYSTLTDTNGHASATCTANTQAGVYRVTATPLALGQSASFSLTNAKKLMITGVGRVTSAALGIDCSNSCSSSIAEGTSVTLSATPGLDQSFIGWSGACSGTASTCTFTANASTWAGAAFTGIAVDIAKGWNLAGNSFTAPITVTNSFQDAAKVASVWKWVTAGTTAGITYPTWAFYAPAQSDGGKAFAARNGYELLTSISGGEGFWVNAKAAFTANLPGVTAFESTSFQSLTSGWHLVATGDQPTPSEFNTNLSASSPAAGTVTQNLTSLWAWDNSQSKWYFHAPSLEAQGRTVLTNYITSKGYLDFVSAGKALENGTGFWVKKP